jgi:hypothetical protein
MSLSGRRHRTCMWQPALIWPGLLSWAISIGSSRLNGVEMEQASDVKTFRYAITYQVIFLVSTVLFLGAAILALRADPEHGGGIAWPAVCFLFFAVLGGLFLWATLPTVKTDPEGITRDRLGLRQRLVWRDVKRVEHRPVSNSMLLCTGSDRLRIQRQIRGFIDLVRIVKGAVPAKALDPPFTMPFQVPASWNLRIVFGGMSGSFLLLGMYDLVVKTEWKSAALFLGLSAVAAALLSWHAFLRFEFDTSGLRVVYPARTVKYAADDLDGVDLVQRDLDIVLALHFGSKTVELSDNQIVLAPERVYESLIGASDAHTEDADI